MAQVKLRANNNIYALPSFFGESLYAIGPAKSRPSTSNGTNPTFLSVGKLAVGGFAKAETWNFFHP